MSDIFTMPTDCAPTNGTAKIPGWAQCSDGCSGCTDCTPNPDSDCGQLMIAGGFTCAPPTCVSKCCMPSEPTDDEEDTEESDAIKEANVLLDKMTKQQKILTGVVIALVVIIIVLCIMLVRNKKQ
jgi:hypothetical protein